MNSGIRLSADMSIDEIARWCCLIESIEVADKQMKSVGVDPEEFDWVRPVAIEHYITERFHSMKSDIEYEVKNGVKVEIDDEFFI